MRKFIIERSEDEFYTSHSGLALIGLGVNRFTKLSGKLKRAMPDTKAISNIDVIRSYIGCLPWARATTRPSPTCGMIVFSMSQWG